MRKKRISALHRALLATGVGLGLSLSQTALAETATDELEIHAGLTQALTLSCDIMSFGVTLINNLSRGETSTVTLDPDTEELSIGGNTEITTSTNATQVQAAGCEISGSRAADGTAVAITLNGNPLNAASFTLSVSGSDHLSMDEPTIPATLTVDNFTTHASPVEIQNGGAQFKIGGTLTIPATLFPTNMGGYSRFISIQVEDWM